MCITFLPLRVVISILLRLHLFEQCYVIIASNKSGLPILDQFCGHLVQRERFKPYYNVKLKVQCRFCRISNFDPEQGSLFSFFKLSCISVYSEKECSGFIRFVASNVGISFPSSIYHTNSNTQTFGFTGHFLCYVTKWCDITNDLQILTRLLCIILSR